MHALESPRRPQVQLDDEIGSRVQLPAAPGRRERRHLAGRPSKEVAVGIIGGLENDALVARLRIRLVELARRRRAVDADVRVMHGAAARQELEAADVTRLVDGNRSHEVAEHIAAVGAKRVIGQRDDEIGHAELPAAVECRRRSPIAAVAFRRAFVDPARQLIDFAIAQPPFADERTRSRIRLPRRHVSTARHFGDLSRVRLRVGEGDQAERRGSVGMMTARAARPEDRRDVAVECDVRVDERRMRGGPFRAAEAGLKAPPHNNGHRDDRQRVGSRGHGDVSIAVRLLDPRLPRAYRQRDFQEGL